MIFSNSYKLEIAERKITEVDKKLHNQLKLL